MKVRHSADLPALLVWHVVPLLSFARTVCVHSRFRLCVRFARAHSQTNILKIHAFRRVDQVFAVYAHIKVHTHVQLCLDAPWMRVIFL